MYLHKTKNGHYTPPCCYFSGELEVVEGIRNNGGGYVYRYWHYVTGESSREIYRQAPAKTMNVNYLMFHTMDPEMAVEDLKEIYRQKRGV